MSLRRPLAPGTPIVLVEPEAGGHHFLPYLLFLAQMLQARGHPLTLLTTPAAALHPAMQRVQQELRAPLPWHPMRAPVTQAAGTLGLLRRQFDYWRSVRDAARTVPERDAVFVLMSADAVDRAMALRGSPFGGRRFVPLFIQLKFHWPALGIGPGGRFAGLSRQAFLQVLGHRDLLAAATIDASLPEALRAHPLVRRLWVIPDPGEIHCALDRTAARAALGLPATAPIVLVYGVIDARKGIPALLAAARELSSLHVVLAGRFAPGHAAALRAHGLTELQAANRLSVCDRYVDTEEEGRLFRAADLVWLGYAPDFNGQSAVLAQAASAGVPVLGKAGGLIGRTIRAAGLGLTVDPAAHDAVVAALQVALTSPPEQLAPGTARFAAARSAAAYRRAWIDCLFGTGGSE